MQVKGFGNMSYRQRGRRLDLVTPDESLQLGPPPTNYADVHLTGLACTDTCSDGGGTGIPPKEEAARPEPPALAIVGE